MKNALILHGTGANPEANWFPWLKDELIKRGWRVWVPDLPRADRPNISRYNNFIFKNKDWEFTKDSVLIGHSSGAVAILGVLQHLPKNKKVDTCILVGSFKDDLGWDVLRGLFQEPFEFEKIKRHSQRFVFVHSDNDPHCPLEHAKFLAQKLDGALIVRKGQGHFNLQASPRYKQFPLLLKLITRP